MGLVIRVKDIKPGDCVRLGDMHYFLVVDVRKLPRTTELIGETAATWMYNTQTPEYVPPEEFLKYGRMIEKVTDGTHS
jgi:hypothetical protein